MASASAWERMFHLSVLLLILLSVVVVVLQSMPEMAEYDGILERLWTRIEERRYGEGWRAQVRYELSPMALVDLAAILPFYLMPFADANTVVFRLLRVLKFGRYHASMGLWGRVISSRREELMISLALVLALVMITSPLMYAVEHDAQPKAFGSIPQSMLWGGDVDDGGLWGCVSNYGGGDLGERVCGGVDARRPAGEGGPSGVGWFWVGLKL